MKTLKIAVTALVIAGGTVGAFAFTKADMTDKKESKSAETTYYAIRIGDTNQFRWTSDVSELDGLECMTLANASCSVVASSQPANNTNPDTTPDHKAYQEP